MTAIDFINGITEQQEEEWLANFSHLVPVIKVSLENVSKILQNPQPRKKLPKIIELSIDSLDAMKPDPIWLKPSRSQSYWMKHMPRKLYLT